MDTEKQIPFDMDLLDDVGGSAPITLKDRGKEYDYYDVVRLLCADDDTWYIEHVVAADKSPYDNFSADPQHHIQLFSNVTGKELLCKDYRDTHYLPPLY
jgi:hypothetical protein